MPDADLLLVRDNKLKQMNEIINSVGSPNIYVFGPKGVGKTLTCKILLNNYPEHQTLYVLCRGSFKKSVISALAGRGIRPRKYVPLTKQIADRSSPLIAVFDDIHEIYNYRRSFHNFFHSLHDDDPDNNVKVILISTWSFQWFRRHVYDDEIRDRYSFVPIGFGNYSAEELRSILEQRVRGAFKKYDKHAIDLIAAKVTRLGAGPRTGLRMLINAWQISENLTYKIAEKTWYKEKKRYWRDDVLRSFDPHTALLFWIIASLTYECVDVNKVIYSAEVYKKYREICEKYGVEPFYDAKLTHHLKELEKADYIDRETVSLGKRGLQSRIQLLFDDPEVIMQAGKEIDWKVFLL